MANVEQDYIENSLQDGEEILAKGEVHWSVFIPGAGLLFIGFMALPGSWLVGIVIIIISLLVLISEYLKKVSTELAVTNLRIIAKFGYFSRNTMELLHKNVEGFNVDQSALGRFLDFGTIICNGTGGMKSPFPGIAKPLRFKEAAAVAIERSQGIQQPQAPDSQKI